MNQADGSMRAKVKETTPDACLISHALKRVLILSPEARPLYMAFHDRFPGGRLLQLQLLFLNPSF